jgi:hypothetical protein
VNNRLFRQRIDGFCSGGTKNSAGEVSEGAQRRRASCIRGLEEQSLMGWG